MKKGKTYITNSKYVSYIHEQIRNVCPNCGHTMMVSVKYDNVLCNHCNKLYKNNSRAYFKKILKEMI